MSGISVVKVVKILLTDKSFQFILYSNCYGIFWWYLFVSHEVVLNGYPFPDETWKLPNILFYVM